MKKDQEKNKTQIKFIARNKNDKQKGWFLEKEKAPGDNLGACVIFTDGSVWPDLGTPGAGIQSGKT